MKLKEWDERALNEFKEIYNNIDNVDQIERSYLIFLHLLLMKFCQIAQGVDNSCTCSTDSTNANSGYKIITYDVLPDDVNVPNPGRGFYRQAPVKTSHFKVLGTNSVQAERTIVQRMYYMDTYINRSLDQVFIRNVKSDLNFLKQQGWMGLIRFSYTPEKTGQHDAGLQRALEHIDYLGNSSLLTQYEGVIAAVQVGFVGVWGEWHEATADFGIPKGHCSPDMMFGISTSQWMAREKVLKALLRVVPKSLQVQLRYPWLKYKLLGNSPTTFQDVLSRTDRGRVGFHNDAFLSTERNMGTYKCAEDKSYLANETRFLVMSGETNDNRTVSRYACGNAMAEMANYHWSMLNEGFVHEINEYWRTHGCHDEIAAKLGYRLFLINATLPSSVYGGGQLCFKFYLGNNGYAAPYKKMNLQIVLQNTLDRTMYNSSIQGVDVRTLLPGNVLIIKGQVGIPDGLHGTFKVFVALTDDIMKYDDNYYVMFANKNVNTSTVRINDLMHTINVTRGSCGKQNGELLVPWTGPTEGCRLREISDGSFEDDGLGWSSTGKGFAVVNDRDAQQGNKYIRISNGTALQIFDFRRSPTYQFTLSGYSRLPNNTVVHTWWKYRIKCDLFHTDGSKTWSKSAAFPQDTRDVWRFKKLTVRSQKVIQTAWCYLEFKDGTGYVDFDNVVLNTCIGSDCKLQFKDSSFEDGTVWTYIGSNVNHKTGRSGAHSGDSFLKISNGSAFQVVDLKGLALTSISVSGYSRAHGVTVKTPADYSIKCDVKNTDGTTSTDHMGLFDPSVSAPTWQQTVVNITSTKVMSSVTCYAVLKDASGSADFDDIQIMSCN